MKKNEISDMLAEGMNTYLESPEFKFLFRKADLDLETPVEDLDGLGSSELVDSSAKSLDDLDLEQELNDLGTEEVGPTDSLSDELNEYEHNSNMAVDGLLSASAALDELGAVQASADLLKLASMVVEAKKKKVKEVEDKKKGKDKKEEKKAKEKAKKDEADARDKKMKEKEKKAKEKAKKEKEKAKK